MSSDSDNEGLDLAGFGKIAKAIPDQVYEQTAATVLDTFEKLIAPITETTDGLGRYIRQKFDNMVDVERALGTYTLDNAIQRAASNAGGLVLQPPQHTKSFVKSLEEASKETDPLLHEMWTNLLASQFIKGASHPHFVEVLPHFSPLEARLLLSLYPMHEVTNKRYDGYMGSSNSWIDYWIRKGGDELHPWNISCLLLLELGLVSFIPPPERYENKMVVLLHRTEVGTAFLSAVTPQVNDISSTSC